jgi:hypothetical protein
MALYAVDDKHPDHYDQLISEVFSNGVARGHDLALHRRGHLFAWNTPAF